MNLDTTTAHLVGYIERANPHYPLKDFSLKKKEKRKKIEGTHEIKNDSLEMGFINTEYIDEESRNETWISFATGFFCVCSLVLYHY